MLWDPSIPCAVNSENVAKLIFEEYIMTFDMPEKYHITSYYCEFILEIGKSYW